MNSRSRTEYSAINIFSNFLGYGINLLLSFVCRIIFVRYLSAEYLGINGLFSNVLSMLSLTELGIGSAIVYALYKPIAENDQKRIASLMSLYGKAYKTIGCTVMALGLMLLPFINVVIRTPPNIPENLYIIYFLYLFNSATSYFFSYRSTILTAHQRNYIVTTISYIIVIVQNIIQIAVLVLFKNYMLYLIVWAICGLITNICISAKAIHDYPYIASKEIEPLPAEEKKTLFKNIKALTIVKISGILVNSTDNIVITFFNGLISTGLASNYHLFIGILNSLLNMVFGGITASVGNLNATENDEIKYLFFRKLYLLNFWLFGWAATGIVFVLGDLVQLFFGKQYVLPFNIPLMLAINFYMVGMLSAVWTYKNSMGLFRRGQYILVFTAIINIIGDIFLGERYGIFGIFAATVVARLCTNVWYDPYAVFKYGLKRNPFEYFRLYFVYLFTMIFTLCTCGIACSMITVCNLWSIIIKILICTIFPNGIFAILFGHTPEFQFFKDKFKKIGSYLSVVKR